MGNLHKFHPVTLAGTVVGGIVEQEANWGVQTTRPIADGNVQPVFAAIISKAPVFSFSTMDLAAALAVVGLTPTAGTVLFFDKKIDVAGAAVSGSNHRKHTMTTAWIVPVSLTCDTKGNAVLSYQCLGYHASGTEPVQIASAQALSSYTAAGVAFGLGPLVLNGTTLTGVQSTTINFGYTPVVEYADGGIIPKSILLDQWVSGISATFLEPDQTAYLSGTTPALVSGVAISGTTKQYFRKRALDGIYVADATAEHVSVGVNAGMIIAESIGGSPRLARVRIEPRGDLTPTNQLAISTGTAIS